MKPGIPRKRPGALAIVLISLVCLLTMPTAALAAPGAIDTKPVEKELICQCGCNMVVETCQCSLAEQIRADLAEKLQAGMSREEIIQVYMEKYGRTVLAYPPKAGFDLTAWIMPFAAVAAGGVGLYFLLRRWVQAGRGAEDARQSGQPGVVDERYRLLVEEELKKYH